MATTRDDSIEDPVQPTFNPLDPQLWVDAYPTLERLRSEDPVHVEPHGGMAAITGHAEAESVFRNPDGDHRYVDYQKQRMGDDVEQQPYIKGMSQWVLMRSGKDHRRLRGTIARDFTPRRVEALRLAMTDAAHELVDGFADAGETDIVPAYSSALPLSSISRLLDVPSKDNARIEQWIEGFKNAVQFLPMTPEQLAETNAAISGLGEYFAALIADRRANPGDDLLTQLIAQADAGQMTQDELVVNAWGLYAAGHETSGNAISDAIHTLLRNPEQLKLLQDDWTLLPNAVDELLRYDGPGLATSRMFQEPIEVAGHTIPADTGVLLFMAGANRDPRRFPDPDRLDITRANAKDHLGFGHGPHRCVGQHMARLTIAIAVQTLFTRLQNVRIAGDVEWAQHTVFHGPRSMRLAWDGVLPREPATRLP
jgi:cytochrome P450